MDNEYNCCICNNYITWEHGGIVCENCNSLFCCDQKCVQGYNVQDTGQSHEIPKCVKCSKKK